MKKLCTLIFMILLVAVGCKSTSYINTKDSIDDNDEKLIKEFRAHHDYSNYELKNLEIKHLGTVDEYKIYYVPFKGSNEGLSYDSDNWIKEGYTFKAECHTRIMGIKSNNLYTIGNLIHETQINVKQLYELLPEEFKKQSNVEIKSESVISPKLITAQIEDPRKAEPMTKLSDTSYDFDKDGIEEKLELYTSAGRDDEGKMLWDDGQKWLLVMQDGEKFYSLISEYVQLGAIYFTVSGIYGEDKMPKITVYKHTSANIELLSYTFDSGKQGYIEQILYNSNASNNVFDSIPSY